VYECKQNGEDFFSLLTVTCSRFGNCPANGLVTEQPQYSVAVCIFSTWQNTEISLISNNLRLIFTYPLLLTSPCIFHHTRHTFAVHSLYHMVKSGLDIYTAWPILSVLLGHHDIYATEHYVRLTLEIYPDLIKETGKNLGDIFPDITNQTNPL
jgi:hypothetical protein